MSALLWGFANVLVASVTIERVVFVGISIACMFAMLWILCVWEDKNDT